MNLSSEARNYNTLFCLGKTFLRATTTGPHLTSLIAGGEPPRKLHWEPFAAHWKPCHLWSVL